MTHAATQGESSMSAEVQKIGFGGGCHWCTEAVFAALRGILRVEQGFIRADAPDDNFSEAVLLTFHPDKISLGSLIEIHLRTHSSTSNHSMRRKYRSAVYVMDEVQAEAARRVLIEVGPGFDAPLVTRILPFRAFKASDERFQRYSEKNAGGPFCSTYIDPKLALLRTKFGALMNKGSPMQQAIVHIALVVRDYDEAIDFYVGKLGFELVEDSYQPAQDKRWVVVAPPGGKGTTLLLARASRPEQQPFVGNQAGGRVFLFLNTGDFERDYARYRAAGVRFVREPKVEDYGAVAVFEDLYGNLWDLLQLRPGHPVAARMLQD